MERLIEPLMYAARWILALVGGLLITVIVSGYENFVSRLDIASDPEKLDWLGTMDASSLTLRSHP